MQSLAFTW